MVFIFPFGKMHNFALWKYLSFSSKATWRKEINPSASACIKIGFYHSLLRASYLLRLTWIMSKNRDSQHEHLNEIIQAVLLALSKFSIKAHCQYCDYPQHDSKNRKRVSDCMARTWAHVFRHLMWFSSHNTSLLMSLFLPRKPPGLCCLDPDSKYIFDKGDKNSRIAWGNRTGKDCLFFF